MAKLKGKRLAQARKNIKKAQKALRAKIRRPKRKAPRKTNKPRKRSNTVAKKKTSRRGTGMALVKRALTGGALGTVITLILNRFGAPSLATDAGYIVASQVGGKPGVWGNAVIRQGLQRFGGSLGFLNGGNGGGGGGQEGFG